MKTLAYTLSVFFLVASVLPAVVAAAPGNTPPWTSLVSETPNGLAVCTAQKGIGKELCLQNQMGTTTTGQYTAPVNGACPIAGTVKVTKCEVDPNAPTTTTATPTGPTKRDGSGFKSLTNIENVTFAGNAAELPDFLNSVYMICIGLAAVIGVLQIMRAGVTWMTAGGSHEKIGDAKNLIRDTIIGLILVLAPTIVFSIINPDILNLQIRGLSDLQTNLPSPKTEPEKNDLGQVSNPKNNLGGSIVAPPPKAAACEAIPNGQEIDGNSNKDNICCASQDNGFVDCQPAARTRDDSSGKVTQLNYCLCTLKPKIGSEYEIYYSGAKGASNGDLQKVGVAPAKKTEYEDLVRGCAQAGAQIKETVKRQNLGFTIFHECPASAGIPADDTKTTKCQTVETLCVPKE